MAITQTTTTGAITLSDLIIPVTSATGFAVGNWVRIDTEWIGAITAVNGLQISVRGRGDQGTAAVPHNALALVSTGLGSDYPTPPPGTTVPEPPDDEQMVEYGVSGAIAVPVVNTVAILNKAGVAAMTLAAPPKNQDGTRLTITSNSAFAHTVTATGLLNTGTATVNLATFAAFAGATLSLVALGGKWNVTGAVAVVLT